jgi:histidine triad (HIT) family protein
MLGDEEAEEIRARLLEQLEKLPEEQVKDLKKQVKHATPEQLEQLIKKQKDEGGECIFCQIIGGKIETIKIYEDNDIFAVLDIFPAAMGHMIVMPKQHHKTIAEIPDNVISKMFMFIKTIEPVFLELTKADGLNIFIAQGQEAGQKVDHFAINIIPRHEKDGISFEWQRQKADKKKLETLGDKIREKAGKMVREKISKDIEKEIKKKKAEDESEAEKISRHVKRRMP